MICLCCVDRCFSYITIKEYFNMTDAICGTLITLNLKKVGSKAQLLQSNGHHLVLVATVHFVFVFVDRWIIIL